MFEFDHLQEQDHNLASRQRAARVWRWRVTGLLALRSMVTLSAVWAFAWGLLVLGARVGLQWHGPVLLWGALGFAPMWAIAVWRALRMRPSLAAARAVLDRHNASGGLVVTEGEAPLGGWAERVSTLALPAVRWRGQSSWLVLAAATAFTLGAFLAPTAFTQTRREPALQVSNRVEDLQTRIETLEKQKLLPEKQARELKDSLDQVNARADGRDPAKTLEALDHTQQQVAQRAAEAAQRAQQQNRRLNESEALAEAMSQPGGELDEKLKREAMAALKQRMNEAMAEQNALEQQLDPALRKALEQKAGELSQQQLDQLRKLSQQAKRELQLQMTELHKARLIDRETLRQCKGAGRTNGEALRRMMAKQGQGEQGKQGEGKGKGGDQKAMAMMPGDGEKRVNSIQQALRIAQRTGPGGRGGISQGPGPTPMSLRDMASSEKNVKFEPETLPPGDMSSLENSKRVGLTSAAPEVNEEGGASAGGAVGADAAGEGGASTHRVLPRHRAAVQQYFNRGESRDGN